MEASEFGEREIVGTNPGGGVSDCGMYDVRGCGWDLSKYDSGI